MRRYRGVYRGAYTIMVTVRFILWVTAVYTILVMIGLGLAHVGQFLGDYYG